MADNETSDNKIKWAIAFLVVLLIVFVLLFMPWTNLVDLFFWLLLFVFVGGLLGMGAYIFWMLFLKPQKTDMTYITKKKLIQSGRISKPDFVRDLYVSGDSHHSRKKLGKIIGWTLIQVYDQKTEDKEDPTKKTEKELKESIVDQSVFVIERAFFPLTLLIDPIVIRVNPKDHTDLVGDVYLKGFSLMKISEYFFLNHEILNTRMIDFNIWRENERGVRTTTWSEMSEIVHTAIGINPSHNLGMERNKMMKVPPPPEGRPEP